MATPILSQTIDKQQIADELLPAMRQRVDEALALLWPADQPMPQGLRALHKAVHAAFVCAGGMERMVRRWGDNPDFLPVRQGQIELLHMACSYVDEALAQLWLSDQPKPQALRVVERAMRDAFRYLSRTERGRAQVRRQLLAAWQGDATDPRLVRGRVVNSNLLTLPAALEVVPGLLAHMQGRESDLEPEGYAAAVDAWLAGQ